jgi:uroporphyrinogen-III synthase
MTQEKSTVELLSDMLGDFDKDTNTDVALEVYLNAKRIASAAAAAQKITQDFAVAQLEAIGGSTANSFAKCHLKREFVTEFERNEHRETILSEMELLTHELKALKENLAATEKQMLEAGLAQKIQTGTSMSVSLLDKI